MRRLERVSLAQIDLEDTTFAITFMPELEPLLTSIQLVGLLEPLLVRVRGDGWYQLVCGFKRAEALRHLSISEAEALIYSHGELGDLQALLLSLGHNLLRPLNLMEKAQALGKLISFGVDEREMIDRFLPLLGLQPNIRILKQVTGLLGLEEDLKKYLVREGLSLSASVLFLHLNREGQRAIHPLLQALRPGENRVKEIITFLREISLRDGVSISSLLARGEIEEVIGDQQTPRPQRLERARRVLKEMRYPRLTELEGRFAEYRRSLSLPPQISFQPPAFFEGDQFRMELRFRDFRKFRELVTKLHQIIEKEGTHKDPLKELGQGR
ncbi:MAG: hypothetical protein JRI46_02915 [Deltaproteobacteria bacterium]|nr:hypothetical protein [Deltaproteobacteria bacterium]